MRAHLIGGEPVIGGEPASFAAAAYLVKDAGFLANNTYVYDASSDIGTLEIAGRPSSGYVLPSGQFSKKNAVVPSSCFSLFPSMQNPGKSIRDDTLEFNEYYCIARHSYQP